MKRWVYAYRYVAGAPRRLEDALLTQAPALLRAATGSPDEPTEVAADGTFTVDLPTTVAGVDVVKRVRVGVGVAYRTGLRVLLPVRWHAEPARAAFPTFEGTMELEPLDDRTAQLALAGSYRVPLGPVGAAIDSTVLHGVAQRTADHLLRLLASGLTQAAGATPADGPTEGPRRGEPLQVADVMTPDPLVLDATLPLRTAALLLFHAEVSGAPVVDDAGRLLGVLSERDLLVKEATARFGFGREAADEDRRRTARTAAEACSRPARVTAPDAKLAEVARVLLDQDISRLVVVEGGRIAGIVTRHDVLAALLRDDTEVAYAVQRVLDAEEATGVRADVTWGEVRLSGTVGLRTEAERLPGLVEAVDGVVAVDAEEVDWERDDLLPPVPYI